MLSTIQRPNAGFVNGSLPGRVDGFKGLSPHLSKGLIVSHISSKGPRYRPSYLRGSRMNRASFCRQLRLSTGNLLASGLILFGSIGGFSGLNSNDLHRSTDLSYACNFLSTWDLPAAGAQETAKPAAEKSAAEDDDFKGTEAFEEANKIRVTESSKEGLGKVIDLCKKALELGLDELDTADAKRMLAATAMQRAQSMLEEMGGGRVPQNRAMRVTNDAMLDLQTAIEYDPNMIDAYVLKARIHLARQELSKGADALDQAQAKLQGLIDAGDKDPELKDKLADVIIMRSISRQDVDERIADLIRALEVNPENEKAVQLTVESLSALGRLDEAEKTIRKFLEVKPSNEYAVRRLVLILVQNEKIAEAEAFLNERIAKDAEESFLYSLRSGVLMAQATGETQKEKLAAARTDADKAIELSDENLDAYLNRARICLALKDLEQAKKDIALLEEKRPEIPDLALLRMDIAIQEKRYSEAISDLERLVQANPENRMLLMQLAGMYQMDDRPRKALRIAERLIQAEGTDWRALRLRGDILLALGRHNDAIADFESAIENASEEDAEELSGILNNLSWVLSTSPEEGVRNGKRALELGLRACELTKYAEAHILSTLAAAYAETGDFDKAVEWSTKAVEVGGKDENEQLDQLKEELKSYQEKKPWREKKETEEKQGKPAKPDSGVDT